MIDDLKLGLFGESCDEGKFGGDSYYSLVMSSDYNEIMELIPEYLDHMKFSVDEEDYKEFKKIADKIEPTAESLSTFIYDDGYYSVSLEVSEGEDVVNQLLDLASFFEDEWEEPSEDENAIIEFVKNNPTSMEAINALYELVVDRIEQNNNSM